MRIQKITISNFRSIECAEVPPESFNFFVGQNNHGKTNFFDAIDFFYNGIPRGQSLDDIRFNHDTTKDVEVAIEYFDLQNGLDSMKNQKHKTTIENVLGEEQTITLSRKNDGKFQITVGGKTLEKNPTGIDAALKDFLPRLEYVKTKKYFDDVGKFDKKTPIGIMLSGVLEAVIEKNEEYRVLKEKFSDLFEGEDSQVSTELKTLSGNVEIYLKKQFPDCTSVRFEISPPQFSEYLKNFETHVDDGVETAVSDKGDGMQRALMLAIIQAYADHRREGEDIGKSFIFLIDEAELHLHPSAQRKLKQALFEISSSGDQVFVNTHSSVLITENFEHQKIFKIEKVEKITSISPIADEMERQNIIYDLLGGSPTDLLLPPNFLIVEGDSEQVFLERIIQKFYSGQLSIKIISAGGFVSQTGRVVDAINKIYAPLAPIYGDRVVILLDEPNAKDLASYTTFRRTYESINNSERLFILNTKNLEDYYPEDLIKGKSRSNKPKLARRIANEITQEDFENNMPIIFQALRKTWELSYGAEDQEQEAA
ncbi:MAG: ATP-binding protein [Planctomycetes bacterium]|nr:ATP-binding protein [Planctomycetota bacterium]